MLASNGETIVIEQLQAIANDIHAIVTMIAMIGSFACGMLFFIFTVLCFKK